MAPQNDRLVRIDGPAVALRRQSLAHQPATPALNRVFGFTSEAARAQSVGPIRHELSVFLLDLRPLLPAAQAEALTEETTADCFRRVFTMLIDRMPGEPWGRTQAMKERFGISW